MARQRRSTPYLSAATLLLAAALLGSASAMPSWYSCSGTGCASNSAPGGLSLDETPQFILLTHDDAITATSNKVVRVVTDRIKNPNGCNVPATWFVLQNGTNCALAQQLLADNHELATHTVQHSKLVPGFNGLAQEMLGVRDWLNSSCGIPKDQVVGFRSPFLIQNPETRKVLHDAGMLYDSSIIEHWPSASSPAKGQMLWGPYDMKSGIPQDVNYTYPDGQGTTAERYPGLWEVPMPQIQAADGTPLFSMDPGGDVYGNLLANFNWTYSGNKAPFGIFIHAPWLTADHQNAVNRFMDYALSLPNVWAVTSKQLVAWMQSPVPASQMNSWYTCKAVNFSAEAKSCQTYTVKSGDSLYSISQATGITAADILATNPSLGTGASLMAGQVVKLPPYPASCTSGNSTSSSGSSSPSPSPAADASCQVATIKAGDTLATVVNSYRVTLADLLAANPNMTATTVLSVGQQVKIPPYPDCCTSAAGCAAASPVPPAAASAASPSPSVGLLGASASPAASSSAASPSPAVASAASAPSSSAVLSSGGAGLALAVCLLCQALLSLMSP